MRTECTRTIILETQREVEMFSGLINIAREELLRHIRNKSNKADYDRFRGQSYGADSVGMSGFCSDQEIQNAYDFTDKLQGV